jgi:polyisoprenoid-binding protein YceI
MIPKGKNQMVIKFLVLIMVASSWLGAANAAADTKQEATEYVHFKIKSMGFYVDGEFSTFQHQISYDEANPEKSKFSGNITVTTINTDIDKRDNHLRTADYFHVDKYPKIFYESTSVKRLDATKLVVMGNITIHGVTRPIEMNVELSKIGGKTVFKATGELNRLDFNVGSKSFILGDDLIFEFQFIK